MYRHAEMERVEEEQLLDKLGDLPMVSDTMTQVLDIYQRTKGHNFLLRSYLGLLEGSAKLAMKGTYHVLQRPIDSVNNYACEKLDSLESTFPIITRPTQEVIDETCSYVEPFVGPVKGPAKLALKVGQSAVGAGMAAVSMGTAVANTAVVKPSVFVASTAMRPALYGFKAGMKVTSAVLNTGMSTACNVASHLMMASDIYLETGLDTPTGRFVLDQTDIALDTVEKLLDFYMPVEEVGCAGTRKERVCELASRIRDAAMAKAKGDIVRVQLLLGGYLHDLVQLFGYLARLTKDTTQMVCREIIESVSKVWNRFVDFLPEPMAKSIEDVRDRVVMLIGHLVGRVGEMLANSTMLKWLALQNIHTLTQQLFHLCRNAPQFLQMGALQVQGWLEVYFPDIAQYIPAVTDFLRQLLDRIFSALEMLDLLAVEVPMDLTGRELEDVAMGNCQGMGVREVQHHSMGNNVG